MYSESYYACFGCQRALAPADPHGALKDGAGQFVLIISLILCSAKWNKATEGLNCWFPPAQLPSTNRQRLNHVKSSASTGNYSRWPQEAPRCHQKKNKWMKKTFRKLVIQSNSTDFLELPGNAAEGAPGTRLSKIRLSDT